MGNFSVWEFGSPFPDQKGTREKVPKVRILLAPPSILQNQQFEREKEDSVNFRASCAIRISEMEERNSGNSKFEKNGPISLFENVAVPFRDGRTSAASLGIGRLG